MRTAFTNRRKSHRGFSLLEMLFATIILLVGLVAIAQLVPASILLNSSNRMDSSALVFAQRELDQMLDQPMTVNSFTDSLGNICQLGNPAATNSLQGNNAAIIHGRTLIVFSSPTPPTAPTNGYGFTYQDPNDPSGTTYDVRWAVIITGSGGTPSSKRFILGVRQLGGSGYFPPITLDTLVEK